MLPDIALEALHYFDRAALEGLQMHSRYLRDLVNRHARTLSLRYIYQVSLGNGNVRFRLLEDQRDGIVVSSAEQNLEMLFHRVNNAFVYRLILSFDRKDPRLPYYLRSNANRLQCRINMLQTAFLSDGTTEWIDYALVDFLGVCLQPQVYETWMIGALREDHALIFTRGSVKHLKYWLFDRPGLTPNRPVPDCITPELFGVDTVETCALTTVVDPLPWIGDFIKRFETAVRGTDVVRSVTLLHLRFHKVSPLRRSAEPLGLPLRTDVPTPRSAFVDEWFRSQHHPGITTTESPTAELFVYKNAELSKKLEVFAWTVEKRMGERMLELNYAFFLQVVDM